MPQINNSFLKSKMNKDVDDRIIPNGEYRDAQNLQISRSAGDSVGEFENILSNEKAAGTNFGFNAGAGSSVIGQFTDEENNKIYVFVTSQAQADGVGSFTDRDITVYSNGAQAGTTITLTDSAGTVIDPQATGIETGMLLQGSSWNGAGVTVDPVVTNVTNADITIDKSVTLLNLDKIVIGYSNSIWELSNPGGTYKILVTGAFLNFSKKSPIYGVNKIDDLLFFTDNRNQPRKINVELANPSDSTLPDHYTREDQISVAKYYPYEPPILKTELAKTITAGTNLSGGAGDANDFLNPNYTYGYRLTMADTTGIKSGDIVTGFPGQGDQELWTVFRIDSGTQITIYNNFFEEPGTYGGATSVDLLFSRSSMKDLTSELKENGFKTSLASPTAAGVPIPPGQTISIRWPFSLPGASNPEIEPSPTPKVGDLFTSSDLGVTIADDIRIMAVNRIQLGTNVYITLNKTITTVTGLEQCTIGANPDYDPNFTGDPDLLEDKFIRLSYRFRYEDNEYSISAPFSQIAFIPKQQSNIGYGRNGGNVDMTEIYANTVIDWFENSIDNIVLKIPVPKGGSTPAEALTSLTTDYKIKNIDILYKETDATVTRIINTVDIANLTVADIEAIPDNSTTKFYYKFDYKSTEVSRTLPESQQNRVFDNVPIKALAQESSGNRIIYGNFVQKHTPPENLDYSVVVGNKSVLKENYCQYPYHSLKQGRNYQVGFVLADRFGRASSVILSSNDLDANTAGSTVYVPYKSFEDIQILTGLSTYEWLGSNFDLTINTNTNMVVRPTADGQPGLYKSYTDSGVDELTIDDGGSGYTVDLIYATTYNPGLGGTEPGVGSGLTVKVTSIGGGGAVTGVEIINPGTGYRDAEIVQLVGGGNDSLVDITVYPPNPLGWQSYKVVVKQQEQEYYNVYLPGYISGYPVTSARDFGRVAFATLISDNINKVPRDLNAVGPLDDEFASSVELIGRVNNPNPNNTNKGAVGDYYVNIEYYWNTQYFPKRSIDEVTVVGPVGQGGLEFATSPFEDSGVPAGEFTNPNPNALPNPIPAQIPWGVIGASQSFYNQEENTFAMGLRVGLQEPQPQLSTPGAPTGASRLNTLGAIVTGSTLSQIIGPGPGSPGIACMIPFLSVSETTPVTSQIEIFYESSTSDNFVDLYKKL